MNNEPAPNKSLGQHWLRDEDSLEAIAEAADLTNDDLVLGAKEVIAVELDPRLCQDLPKLVNAPNLKVINADILKFNLNDIPAGYKIAANLPYYLTSNFIRVISESANPPKLAVILIQKEVAERLNAGPGSMSILSATAQFYWEVSLGLEVPAEFFDPPPKVDSQVVILNRRPKPLFDVDAKDFFRIVKAGFSQKRKTLLNSLSAGLRIDKEEINKVCTASGVDSGRRAQSLSLDEWQSLYKELS
jgi:16S rRNA (adenine1518-N6/adenine1519-N6)-dimethyltransferase